jgi:phage FluMu gp28-like protein
MTATWALVYMLWTGGWTPQYAVPFSSRAECMRNIPSKEKVNEKYICVPISKD